MPADRKSPKASKRRWERSAARGRRALHPNLVKVLVASALPAAALVWFLLLGAEKRARVLASFPSGSGTRILHAVIALGFLMVLAWLALPLVHGGESRLRRGVRWFACRRSAARVLLFPIEAPTYLLWLLFQGLFWLLSASTIACSLLVLAFIVWIVVPGFLGGSGPVLEAVRSLAARVGLGI